MKTNPSIIIVGGGLAGLACANRLHKAGSESLILEASDAAGGRVRTDELDGFLLDRGFQVYLSAYPEAGRLLDLDALQLLPFKPGALVFKDGRFRRLMDVFRSPQSAVSSALQPIGSLWDKLLVGKMRWRAKRASLHAIANGPDRSTEDHLRKFGISEAMIDDFFRPFYGGIFLERELRTSSRMFEFTFKMFAEGHATLPARGMQEIPRQLAARLPRQSIRLNSPVAELTDSSVTLRSGLQLQADTIVIATDGETASRLAPGELAGDQIAWRSVTSLYFSAPKSPLDEAIIALNAEPGGLVNHVCVPSDLAWQYAPPGKALVSVTVLGIHDAEQPVRAELRQWFGEQVDRWELLRTYKIPRALPEQLPGATQVADAAIPPAGPFICGDHRTSTSIEGAITSGIRTAEAILKVK